MLLLRCFLDQNISLSFSFLRIPSSLFSHVFLSCVFCVSECTQVCHSDARRCILLTRNILACQSVRLCVRQSISLTICLSVCLSVCLSAYLSNYLSVCLSISLLINLCLCLSVFQSVYLCVYQSIYMS